MTKFKMLAIVALLAVKTVNCMYYNNTRLECKTCCNGQAPDKPTPENKDNSSSPAPSTPRPTK